MRKILILLLLFISTNTTAQWIELGSNVEQTFVFSIEKSSIRKTKNKVRFWRMDDFIDIQKSDTNFLYLSSTIFYEIDCIERTINIIEMSFFDRNKLNGKIVKTYDNSTNPKPVNIRPETIADELRMFVCK